jgi:hypothetical protein
MKRKFKKNLKIHFFSPFKQLQPRFLIFPSNLFWGDVAKLGDHPQEELAKLAIFFTQKKIL